MRRPGSCGSGSTRRIPASGIYAYEQRRDQLEEPYAGLLKKNTAAWEFFQAQPPSYRKTLGWWIISAKQEETRMDRLKKAIDASAKGVRLR